MSIFCEKKIHVFYPLDFLLCQKERGKIQRFSKPTKFRINEALGDPAKKWMASKKLWTFRSSWLAFERSLVSYNQVPEKGMGDFFPVSFSHQIVNFLPCGPTVRDSLGRSYYTNWSLTCLTYVYRSAASFWGLTGGNQPPKQTNKWWPKIGKNWKNFWIFSPKSTSFFWSWFFDLGTPTQKGGIFWPVFVSFLPSPKGSSL